MPDRLTLAGGLLVMLATGCSGSEPVTTLPTGDGPVDWIVEVVRDPAAFTALMESTGRDGWVALHGNDLAGARIGFSGDSPAQARARARAEWELALLYEDLSRAEDQAMFTFLSSWAARELPATDGLTTIAAQWRGCDGLSEVGVDNPDKLPALFHADAGAQDVLDERAVLHERAAGGDVGALLAAVSKPMVVEREETFERTFYDACVYRTLHETWEQTAAATVNADDWRGTARAWTGDSGLEGRMFAPWLTSADLEHQIAALAHAGTLGATQPSLASFGVSTETSVQDDVEVAREDVRALDAAIDARNKALLAEASDDGKALLTDLALHHRFRQEWIAARARKALLEDRPHQAMAYLELARDVSERGVGPTNTPSVLALYAEAQIRLGRTREALDVLSTLEETHPEVVALRELTSDLAVLQGLDRQGDSKEN